MDTTQTTLYHALLINSAIMLLVIFGFCYTIFRSRQRYNNMLLTYMVEQIHSLERERARIAYDLHDDLGPLFSATRIVISAAGDAKTINKELVDKICLNLDQANERMDSIVHDLSFSFLKRKGLAASLQDHFEQYKQGISTDIQLTSEVQTKINEDTELQLFRMIQELVHNAVKHSGAKLITVHIKERDKKLYIHCTDNGIGINETDWKDKEKGVGFRSLRYRVAIMGGSMRVDFRKGTEYLFEIPIIK